MGQTEKEILIMLSIFKKILIEFLHIHRLISLRKTGNRKPIHTSCTYKKPYCLVRLEKLFSDKKRSNLDFLMNKQY